MACLTIHWMFPVVSNWGQCQRKVLKLEMYRSMFRGKFEVGKYLTRIHDCGIYALLSVMVAPIYHSQDITSCYNKLTEVIKRKLAWCCDVIGDVEIHSYGSLEERWPSAGRTAQCLLKDIDDRAQLYRNELYGWSYLKIPISGCSGFKLWKYALVLDLLWFLRTYHCQCYV